MIPPALHLDLIEMVPIISDHPSTSTIYQNFKSDTAIIGAIEQLKTKLNLFYND